MLNQHIIDWIQKQEPIIISSIKKAVPILYSTFIERKTIVFCNDIPYIWTGTHYMCVVDQDILFIILNLIRPEDRICLSPSVPKVVYEKLRLDDRVWVDIEGEADKNRMFVNVKNGVYSIEKQQLLPHDEKMKFNYELDFEYVEGAAIYKAPVFKKFVESSLGAEKQNFLLQIIGYCCSSLIGARTAFNLVGSGKRGKSVILLFIENVVDEMLRSSLSFSDIGRREYIVHLIGKIVNICTDNDPSPMKNESLFKRITASENVVGRDLYKSAVAFKPTAKLIFASNHDLAFTHPDDELWDRVTPLCFTKAIPEQKRDTRLLDKLLGEKNVIMSMALNTLHSLVESGYEFALPPESKEYLERRRAELHPERIFLQNQVVLDAKGEVSSAKLWEAFRQFCSDNAVEALGQKKFLKQVEDYNDGIIKTMIGPANKRINGFKGIRFKTADDFETEGDKQL